MALGDGLAGSGGPPYLSVFGTLAGGTPLRLLLEDAPPSAVASLVVGLVQLGAPFKGGVLVPSPDLVLPLVTDATGALDITGAWPGGVPAATDLFFQAWIPDASGPVGFVASGAAQGTTP